MPFSKKFSRATLIGALVCMVALGFGCSRQGSEGGAGGSVRLQGAGATFPNPLYQKWLSEYTKLNPNVRIDYQSIGSGGRADERRRPEGRARRRDSAHPDGARRGRPDL
jgi:ABC-type phosphate transport system substrate-binding protein